MVQHRRLMLAKKQLAADSGYTVPQVQAPQTQDLMEQRPPEQSWSVSLPQEELWDESIFYRQPSVDQVLQAQQRWCQQYQKEAEIASLCAMPSAEILQQMRSLEGRLQLRMRGPGRAWRSPCAVGPCARGMLEAVLETAQDPGGIPHWLVPVAALLQLCLASSYQHWMEPSRSYQHLDQLEASLHGAPNGSYAEAVSPALHARSTLLRAVLALREGRHAAAEVAARDALQMLQALKRGKLSKVMGPMAQQRLGTNQRLVEASSSILKPLRRPRRSRLKPNPRLQPSELPLSEGW